MCSHTETSQLFSRRCANVVPQRKKPFRARTPSPRMHTLALAHLQQALPVVFLFWCQCTSRCLIGIRKAEVVARICLSRRVLPAPRHNKGARSRGGGTSNMSVKRRLSSQDDAAAPSNVREGKGDVLARRGATLSSPRSLSYLNPPPKPNSASRSPAQRSSACASPTRCCGTTR